MASHTADEMMTVAASRELRDGTVCFVGIGLPSEAANLAKATHAPGCVLIYESGTIGAKPDVLPLSIGDGVLAAHADSVVSVPEIFNYWLQAGRVDAGFLGAAQAHRFGNINTTVVGDYRTARVRPAGAGGAAATGPPRASATTARPGCGCPARAGRPRSPPGPGRSSSCSARSPAPSSRSCPSSPRSATPGGPG